MSVANAFLISGQLLQLCSYVLIYRHNRLRKSVAGISCDFTVYSWVSALASAGSSCAYALLLKIKQQYAVRYPVYPELDLDLLLFVVDVALATAASALVFQVFVTYRASIVGGELLSLPCKALLALFCGGFLWFFLLFCRQRATINQLDLADCAWTIGTLCFAVRLPSQVSQNFFLDRCTVMHRHFLHWQAGSLLLMCGGYWLMKHLGIRWYEQPANVTSVYALIPNAVCLVLLGLQANTSRKTSYMPV